MNDPDDDLELEAVRVRVGALAGPAHSVLERRPVLSGVVLSVLAASFALAVLPYTLGAVGGEAVQTTPSGPSWQAAGDQQYFANAIVSVAGIVGRMVLPLVAVGATFVGVLVGPGECRSRRRTIAVASGGAVALGYALVVVLGSGAIGETDAMQGPEVPVVVHFGALAVNGLALGVAAAVGSAVTVVAGTLLGGPADT